MGPLGKLQIWCHLSTIRIPASTCIMVTLLHRHLGRNVSLSAGACRLPNASLRFWNDKTQAMKQKANIDACGVQMASLSNQLRKLRQSAADTELKVGMQFKINDLSNTQTLCPSMKLQGIGRRQRVPAALFSSWQLLTSQLQQARMEDARRRTTPDEKGQTVKRIHS